MPEFIKMLSFEERQQLIKYALKKFKDNEELLAQIISLCDMKKTPEGGMSWKLLVGKTLGQVLSGSISAKTLERLEEDDPDFVNFLKHTRFKSLFEGENKNE